MEMFNYSIIIPHYNDFDRLCRCINSIPLRKDIQIIVIDDVSNSEIVEKVKIFCENRDNIEFYQNTTNNGAGYSRNVGIDYSLGKWLIFADCDDLFTRDAFKFFDVYIKSEFDIVYFDSIINNEIKKKKVQESNKDNITAFLTKSNVKKIRTSNWEPWGKMFKRSFIIENNIKFNSVKVMNDAFFSISAGLATDNIFADYGRVYEYIIYNSSISRQANMEKDLIRIKEINRINKRILSYKSYLLYTIDIFLPIFWFIKVYGIRYFSLVINIFKKYGFYSGLPFYSLLGKIRRNIKK